MKVYLRLKRKENTSKMYFNYLYHKISFYFFCESHQVQHNLIIVIITVPNLPAISLAYYLSELISLIHN